MQCNSSSLPPACRYIDMGRKTFGLWVGCALELQQDNPYPLKLPTIISHYFFYFNEILTEYLSCPFPELPSTSLRLPTPLLSALRTRTNQVKVSADGWFSCVQRFATPTAGDEGVRHRSTQAALHAGGAPPRATPRRPLHAGRSTRAALQRGCRRSFLC